MKRIFNCHVIVILMIVLAMLIGCSSKEESPGTVAEADESTATSEVQAARPQPVTMKDTIEYNLNLALNRLRLGDKSGLFENEFEYMFGEETFDDYLEYRHVKFARADTIKWVEVTEVIPYAHDSAELKVIVHFEGPAGIETEFEDNIKAHFHKGRWIKPTASNLKGQLEWEAGER
ncbi:MAG: hypothetical protein JSV52_07010 [Candidatus Zixiibacteriota bacterium]|nr:MAG: hypothetical protein JSV52_07010 [candidate division Zixibacteria bacterium]